MLARSGTPSHSTSNKPINVPIIASEPVSDEAKQIIRSTSPQISLYKSKIYTANTHKVDAVSPGTMAFNDTQNTTWALHTPPRVSAKVQKKIELRKIAYDQEVAGIHFNGRRSFAEAEANLAREQLAQTSQAARAQNPLEFIGDSLGDLIRGLSYYFENTHSITTLNDQFSTPIFNTKYIVRKSESIIKNEAAGNPISQLGVGLIDNYHSSIAKQNGIETFLNKHF
jgi:hypothetical protein